MPACDVTIGDRSMAPTEPSNIDGDGWELVPKEKEEPAPSESVECAQPDDHQTATGSLAFSKEVRWYREGARVKYTVDGDHVTQSYVTIGDSTPATMTGTSIANKEIDVSQCTVFVPGSCDGSGVTADEVYKLEEVNAALGELKDERGCMMWDGAVNLLLEPSIRGTVSGKARRCFTYGKRDEA